VLSSRSGHRRCNKKLAASHDGLDKDLLARHSTVSRDIPDQGSLALREEISSKGASDYMHMDESGLWSHIHISYLLHSTITIRNDNAYPSFSTLTREKKSRSSGHLPRHLLFSPSLHSFPLAYTLHTLRKCRRTPLSSVYEVLDAVFWQRLFRNVKVVVDKFSSSLGHIGFVETERRIPIRW
jgi:hypothetical protein